MKVSYHGGSEQGQEKHREGRCHARKAGVDEKVGSVPGPSQVDVVGIVEEPDGPQKPDDHEAQVQGDEVASTEQPGMVNGPLDMKSQLLARAVDQNREFFAILNNRTTSWQEISY